MSEAQQQTRPSTDQQIISVSDDGQQHIDRSLGFETKCFQCHDHHYPPDIIFVAPPALQTTSGKGLNEIDDNYEYWNNWFKDHSDSISTHMVWKCSCIPPAHTTHTTACNALAGLWCSACDQLSYRNVLVHQLNKENAKLLARAVAAEADNNSIKAELNIKQTDWADSILHSTKSNVKTCAERDDFKARLERKEKELADSILSSTKLTEKAREELDMEKNKLTKAYEELEQLRVLMRTPQVDESQRMATKLAAELAATKLQLEKANTALRAAERKHEDLVDHVNGNINDIQQLVISFSPSLDEQE